MPGGRLECGLIGLTHCGSAGRQGSPTALIFFVLAAFLFLAAGVAVLIGAASGCCVCLIRASAAILSLLCLVPCADGRVALPGRDEGHSGVGDGRGRRESVGVQGVQEPHEEHRGKLEAAVSVLSNLTCAW